MTVEDSLVHNAKPVKATPPAQVVKAVVQPDDGISCVRAAQTSGREGQIKSNNEAANEAPEQTGPVTGVDGEEEGAKVIAR